MSVLSDIAESEVKFYAGSIDFTIKFCLQIIQNNYPQEEISSLALEIITTICEKRPKLVRNNAELLQSVCMAVGTRMLMTTHEVDEDWSNPTVLKDDGGEDEADSDPIKEG